MYEIIEELNESLGNLNAGSSEFKEIVKVLLKYKRGGGVTPNSNIVNFTVRDVKEVPKKVMQIAANHGEAVSAIYLSTVDDKGIIISPFGYDTAFDERITMTTPVYLAARVRDIWGEEEIKLFTTKYQSKASPRLRDVGDFNITGALSGAIIFEDPNVRGLRNDRFKANLNTDPLARPEWERRSERNDRLKTYKAHKASKEISVEFGELTFNELASIKDSSVKGGGITIEGVPSRVTFNSEIRIPKSFTEKSSLMLGTTYDLSDGKKNGEIVLGLRTGSILLVNF